MSDNQKRGPLDRVSKQYIEEHSHEQTPEEIAAHLRRNPRSVRSYITKHNLKPYSGPGPETDDEDDMIRRQLKTNPWYDGLKEQFTPSELIYFTNLWVTLNKQLECDVLDSEKLQMKKYITYEILKDRTLRSQRQKLEELEESEQKIRAELDKPQEARDARALKRLADRISELKNMTPTLLREFKELSTEQEKVNAALKMSRDDRVKNVKDAKNSWTNVVKLLEDPYYRKKVGTHIEVHRAAQKQELHRLMSTHRYIDGNYDEPVQSGKYEDEREEESNN